MNIHRLFQVLWREFGFNVRRPLFWIALLLLLLLAWQLGSGSAMVSSGESTVGGQQAWNTSEFAVGVVLCVVLGLLFVFFLAVAAGMSIIKDEEWQVTEIVRATPLRPSEYVWGKFLGVFSSFFLILLVYLAVLALFQHLLPSAEMAELRGPFVARNYLRPAFVLGLPPALLIAGLSFALGGITRKGILVFLFPVAFLLGTLFFFWSWSPSWLDPEINRLLMLLDPSGFRWLDRTYIAVDRGVEFYNSQPIAYDGGFLLSRLVFVVLGMGAVSLVPLWVGGRQRLEGKPDKGKQAAEPEPEPLGVEGRVAIGPSAGMSSAAPSFWNGLGQVLRSEFRELIHSPGFYLFGSLILFVMIGTTTVSTGAFDTPLLHTAGALATEQAEALKVFFTLLLLFYAVETLERDRTTGLASISYPAPVGTATILFGKALALLGVLTVILAAMVVENLIILGVQGTVPLTVVPFVQVWGILLIPTCLVWITLIMMLMGLTRSRWATYGIGLGILALTAFLSFEGKMNWLTNWWAEQTIVWTDMGFLELVGRGLLLNRLFILSLALLFFILAVKWFPRVDRDPVGLLSRIRPKPLLFQVLLLSPFLLLPFIMGVTLWVGVYQGFQGDLAQNAAKDYWRRNEATWTGVKTPALVMLDLDVELEPQERAFTSRGRYLIYNHLEDPVERIPFTEGPLWDTLTWTMGGEPIEPENRSGLWVVEPEEPLQPGDSLWVGFHAQGVYPKGLTENGGGVGNFILPSSVVVNQSIVPVLGYQDNVGVDEDNRSEPKERPKNLFTEQVDPLFGFSLPMTTRIRITGPDYMTFTSVGNRISEERRDGKVTVVWESDYPVRFFNVVGGKWDVRRGEGTEIYYYPDHHYNVEEMGLALDASRRWYSEWFAPYPWSTLRVNEFMGLAAYAQGFATNITFSESIGFLTKNDLRTLLVFWVTAHEAAHQWWGNTLTPGDGPGGNIISEGMANFSTLLLTEEIKGEAGRRELAKRFETAYARGRRPDDERPMVDVDGSRQGDGRVTYEKGGWVPWMLMNLMGREATLEGLRDFIARFRNGPDYPLLQDQLAVLREFAPDTLAFDAFVEQWYFDVVVPEFEIEDPEVRSLTADGQEAEAWETTFTLRNKGTGSMPVSVAVTVGEPYDDEGEPVSEYREVMATLTLGAGEEQVVTIRSDFEPDRIVVDPHVQVLQLNREHAVYEF